MNHRKAGNALKRGKVDAFGHELSSVGTPLIDRQLPEHPQPRFANVLCVGMDFPCGCSW